MEDIVNNKRKEFEKLKHLLISRKDEDTINKIEGLYINGNISTEVLIEYLRKNLCDKKITERLYNTNKTEKKAYKTENLPLISVIIPTYGGYLPIEQSIDSVLKQNYENIEVIIMDDAGNDVTKEFILNKYNKNNKVKYFQSKNKILSGADKRKIGLKKSHGKYVVFLDHDDYYIDSEFFRRAVKFYERDKNEKFAIYASNVFLYNQRDDCYEIKCLNVSGEYMGQEYLYGFQIDYDKPLSVFPSVFVKEKLLKSGILKSNILNDSVIYMYACLSGKVFISDYIIGAYRVGVNASSNSVTFIKMISMLEEKRDIMLKISAAYPEKNWNKWLLRQTELALDFADKHKYQYSLKELCYLELWGFKNCKKDFKECGKYFLAKYIEHNTSYNYSDIKKIKRLQGYYDLLNRWLIIKNRGDKIDEYLKVRGWKKICIYGYGEIGKRLYEEIHKSEKITIVSIIDSSCKNKNLFPGINIYSLSDQLPESDIIIITPIFAIDNIKNSLEKKEIHNYISIEDILREIY